MTVKRSAVATTKRYDAKSAAALAVCEDYLKQAQAFLDGERTELPDPSALANARFPGSTTLNARHNGDDKFNRARPFIAAVLEDRDAPTEQRNERYFDPWYFVVMSLMDLAGGHFRFDRSKGGKYFYLAYMGPDGTEGAHYLTRMIVNTPSRADTRQKGMHHDYRRATLKETPKKVIQALGQETQSKSRTREDAIQFATSLFERQSIGTDEQPALELDRLEYEKLLRSAFILADRMHEKLLAQKALGVP